MERDGVIIPVSIDQITRTPGEVSLPGDASRSQSRSAAPEQNIPPAPVSTSQEENNRTPLSDTATPATQLKRNELPAIPNLQVETKRKLEEQEYVSDDIVGQREEESGTE